MTDACRHSVAPRHNKSLQRKGISFSPSSFPPSYRASQPLKRRKKYQDHDFLKAPNLNVPPTLDPNTNGGLSFDDPAAALRKESHVSIIASIPTSNSRMQCAQALHESVILKPYEYISSMPSKGVRTTLIDSLNIWHEVEPKQLDCVKDIIKMLHNSSLILDDIEDGSRLRRSRPSAHAVFGTAQSINSATYVYVQAVRKVFQGINSAEALPILLKDLERLFIGQSWDLYWSYNLICPSEEEYLSMIDHKTGALFHMLVGLMQAYSPFRFNQSTSQQGVNLDKISYILGRFFQIRDDYLNITSSVYTDQKGVCEDFEEGKISYLIVHCLHTHPRFKDAILGIFRQRSSKPEETMGAQTKEYILNCLREAGSLQATKILLDKLEKDLEDEIGRLEVVMGERNPLLRLLIKSLTLSSEK